ncbi:MAG TPA: flavodoxin-dependent (E)-4-hydroxy-3-methylbut-2-enyl-diphosphate synthase [Tissierellaceae bacterium]
MESRKTRVINVGGVLIGGDNKVSIQSMTNTQTKDIENTVKQVLELEKAGCDIIRMAISDIEDAKAIPKIKEKINIPIIADIQYDYKLAIYAIEEGVDGLRINPGNIGGIDKVEKIVKLCKEKDISIRVGVNAGSLSQKYLDEFGGVNEKSMVYSALEQVELLESLDFFNIKISLKASNVPLTIKAYKEMSKMRDYPLHLGITEAGPVRQGTIKSAVGIGSLLSQGIGDTIRISLTGDPVEEVLVAKEILKSLDLRQDGIEIISCPTCGRTKIDLIKMVEIAEQKLKDIDKPLKVAIMGCAVNGPGEAKEADIGIAGGNKEGLIFKKGEIIEKVKEEELLDKLLEYIDTL